MKLVFILVLAAFTVCLSRELDRHRHRKSFLRGEKLYKEMLTLGQSQGKNIIGFSLNMGQISGLLEKSSMDVIE